MCVEDAVGLSILETDKKLLEESLELFIKYSSNAIEDKAIADSEMKNVFEIRIEEAKDLLKNKEQVLNSTQEGIDELLSERRELEKLLHETLPKGSGIPPKGPKKKTTFDFGNSDNSTPNINCDIDIRKALESLSKRRPIFHSEADFKFELAWEIKTIYESVNVRLEKNIEIFKDKNRYIDIYLENSNSIIGIELKYKTKGLKCRYNDESYCLSNQASSDHGDYDYLHDINRLEKFVQSKRTNPKSRVYGYAIMITNDRYFWNNKRKEQKIGFDFRINNGRIINKNTQLSWRDNASNGSKKRREELIQFTNSYELKWKEYSNLNCCNRNNEFRYLLVSIP